MSLILQSETQLTSKYGLNAAKTIINSCDTYLYFGGTDIDTARSIALRINIDLKNILELPYGMEYVFQRNEKAILTHVVPIDTSMLDSLSKNEVTNFNEHLKKGAFGKTQFQRFIDTICVEDFDNEENDRFPAIDERMLN